MTYWNQKPPFLLVFFKPWEEWKEYPLEEEKKVQQKVIDLDN